MAFSDITMNDYQRRLRLDAVATALATADDTTLEEWRDESNAWAGVDLDHPTDRG